MNFIYIFFSFLFVNSLSASKCLFGKWPNIHEEQCQQFPEIDKFRGCMVYYDGSHLNFGCIDSTIDTDKHCDVDEHGKILECCFTENCNNMKKKLVDTMQNVVDKWNSTHTCYVGSSLTSFSQEQCVSVKQGGHYVGCLTLTYTKNNITVIEKKCLTAHTALNNCILKLSKRSNGGASYSCCYGYKCNDEIHRDSIKEQDDSRITNETSKKPAIHIDLTRKYH